MAHLPRLGGTVVAYPSPVDLFLAIPLALILLVGVLVLPFAAVMMILVVGALVVASVAAFVAGVGLVVVLPVVFFALLLAVLLRLLT